MVNLNNARTLSIEYGVDLIGILFTKVELQHLFNNIVFYINDECVIVRWTIGDDRGGLKTTEKSAILSKITDEKVIKEFGEDIGAIQTLIKNGYFDA